MMRWSVCAAAAVLLIAVIAFLPGAASQSGGKQFNVAAFHNETDMLTFHAEAAPTAVASKEAEDVKSIQLDKQEPYIPEIQPTASPDETPMPEAGGKVVYLTFDDGPCIEGDSPTQNTAAILDLLVKYHIKATFFVMGAHANKFPELVKREFDEGHVIGNHTYSHVDPKTTPDDKFLRQVHSTNGVIKRITGERPTLFRPPFGRALSPGQHSGLHMAICGWNLDTLDWTGSPAEKVIAKVKAAAEKGKKELRILFHDRHAPGLEQCIQILIANGYRFDTLDHWHPK